MAQIGYGQPSTPEELEKALVLRTRQEMEARDLAETSWRTAFDEAAAHLFSVAAGLDSMVLGEHEILGQVTGAMETALAEGAAGKVLSSC